jgi:hypothetical protein
MAASLAPTNSIVQQNALTHPYTASATNSTADPQVVTPYDVAVTFNTWRNNPGFLGAILISADLPPNLLGNYHLQNTSPAINLGAASQGTVNAPSTDIDGQARPTSGGTGFDAGADESAVPGAGGGGGGTGTASITSVSLGTLSGTTLNFGSLSGTTNASVITYTATGSVVFGNVTVQGGNGNRFSEGAAGTCQNTTVTNGSCTVVVNFDASGNLLRTGALTVTINGSPTTLTLTGQ